MNHALEIGRSVYFEGKEFYIHDVEGDIVVIAEYPPKISVPIQKVKLIPSRNYNELSSFSTEVLTPLGLKIASIEKGRLFLLSHKTLTPERANLLAEKVKDDMELYPEAFPESMVISLGYV